MSKELTTADLIIVSMPFSDELIQWTEKHPDFAEALKIIYPDSFLTLQSISITYPQNGDQVLGIFAYDRNQKKFKQDFVVNKSNQHKEFLLYTKLPGSNPNYTANVQHINSFFSKYGAEGHYANTHHPKFEELPVDIQRRAKQVLQLAERLDKTGLRVLSQAELRDLYIKIKDAKESTKL